MLSPRSRLPAPPCRLCLVLPADTRCCPLAPSSQLPRRCRVKAGGLLLTGGYSFCQGSDQARRFARREKEMKGQLPPTSTPSRSVLFSGSSQNHPKFSLLPHSHHTPLCHFRMGFATWLRACGCARLLAQLPQQSTRPPPAAAFPLPGTAQQRHHHAGACSLPLWDLSSPIAVWAVSFYNSEEYISIYLAFQLMQGPPVFIFPQQR